MVRGPEIDLNRFNEETRRRVWDFAVQIFFARPTHHRGEEDPLWSTTPEDVQMSVLPVAGRWLVMWLNPEMLGHPIEAERWSLSSLRKDGPGQYTFLDID